MRRFPVPMHFVSIGLISPVGQGDMPSGEVRKFKTEKAYHDAYKKELDEFVDEMARLENVIALEFPEDYRA